MATPTESKSVAASTHAKDTLTFSDTLYCTNEDINASYIRGVSNVLQYYGALCVFFHLYRDQYLFSKKLFEVVFKQNRKQRTVA
jgi:hypothetical protein